MTSSSILLDRGISDRIHDAYGSRIDMVKANIATFVDYNREKKVEELDGYSITIDDVMEFEAFFLHAVNFYHSKHSRDSGDPYLDHAIGTARIPNKIGFIDRCLDYVHDVIEEDLSFKEKQDEKLEEDEKLKYMSGMYHHIMLEMYNFIDNSGRIRDLSKNFLYGSLNIIMSCLKNMTRSPGRSFIEYIYEQILHPFRYTNFLDQIKYSQARAYIPPIFDVENMDLLYSQAYRDMNQRFVGKDNLEMLIGLLTLKEKVSDYIYDSADLGGYSIQKRCLRHFKKETLILGASEKYTKAKKSKQHFEPIMHSIARLARITLAVITYDMFIEHDSKIQLGENDRMMINELGANYQYFWKVTPPGMGSPFDGTVRRYQRALCDKSYEEKLIGRLMDPKQAFIHLSMFKEHFSKFYTALQEDIMNPLLPRIEEASVGHFYRKKHLFMHAA